LRLIRNLFFYEKSLGVQNGVQINHQKNILVH